MGKSVEYRVNGKRFDWFNDARSEAECIMSGLPDDGYVMIERKYAGDDFFEPINRIERDNDHFVLR